MSAQLDKLDDPWRTPLCRVFNAQGLSVSGYLDPCVTIDPDQFYGSITGGYTANIRSKMEDFLLNPSIAVLFKKITEGRPYSIALRLREMGYKGELHAVGAANREIMHHLVRVGFSHIHLADQVDSIPKEVWSPFSFSYQAVGGAEAIEFGRRM